MNPKDPKRTARPKVVINHAVPEAAFLVCSAVGLVLGGLAWGAAVLLLHYRLTGR